MEHQSFNQHNCVKHADLYPASIQGYIVVVFLGTNLDGDCYFNHNGIAHNVAEIYWPYNNGQSFA